MSERNVRFDGELHDLFARELAEVKEILEIAFRMFAKCYPEAERGSEARIRRGVLGVLRELENVRQAAQELREKEGR